MQSPQAGGPIATAAAAPTVPHCPPITVIPDHPAEFKREDNFKNTTPTPIAPAKSSAAASPLLNTGA
eukprot:bmy_17495T0